MSYSNREGMARGPSLSALPGLMVEQSALHCISWTRTFSRAQALGGTSDSYTRYLGGLPALKYGRHSRVYLQDLSARTNIKDVVTGHDHLIS